MAKKDKEQTELKTTGKLSQEQVIKLLRKMATDDTVAKVLQDVESVPDWIPTGCRLLDSITHKDGAYGIPVTKIIELAGDTGTGKSYIAAQIAANAQRKNYSVVMFDSEHATDPDFLEKIGCDTTRIVYSRAKSVEYVLNSIDALLSDSDDSYFFVWDSLALTPTEATLEMDEVNPMASMALKARILSEGFQKIIQKLPRTNSTLLIVNQLKTNITKNPMDALVNPYFTSGGKTPSYAYSLRIWLTGSKSKASFVDDASGNRQGTLVRAKIEKSRFGTYGRSTEFQILWGDDVRYHEVPFWIEILKQNDNFTQAGAWVTMKYEDGTFDKFTASQFEERFATSDKFQKRVLELLDEELIKKAEPNHQTEGQS